MIGAARPESGLAKRGRGPRPPLPSARDRGRPESAGTPQSCCHRPRSTQAASITPGAEPVPPCPGDAPPSARPARTLEGTTEQATWRGGTPEPRAARTVGERDAGGSGDGAVAPPRTTASRSALEGTKAPESLRRPSRGGASPPIDRKRPSDGRSPGMDPGPQGAFEVSMINVSCNSHYFSQLAAFFIDARAE